MTPGRLRECLRAMHWTNATLAEALGCTETLVIAWILGFTEIPDEVGAWIEPLGQAHEVRAVHANVPQGETAYRLGVVEAKAEGLKNPPTPFDGRP